MPWKGFSTSAPTLSLDEVKKEKDALSLEERQQLSSEMLSYPVVVFEGLRREEEGGE